MQRSNRLAKLERNLPKAGLADDLDADDVDLAIAILRIRIAEKKGASIDSRWTCAVGAAPAFQVVRVEKVLREAAMRYEADAKQSCGARP